MSEAPPNSEILRRAETYLSYSQGSTYAQDAYEAWLGRVLGIPSRPGWSTLGGTAFHRAVEAYDLRAHGYGGQTYSVDPLENLDQAVREELERTHGLYTEADIRASMSGKGVPRDGRGADRAWIEKNLPLWFEKWKNWRRNLPWDLALLPDKDGVLVPAVEVGFEFAVAEDVILRGSVDAVYTDRRDADSYIVVDYKAGARKPDSGQQLGVYRAALLDQYDATADRGTFYMARDGVTTEVYDLRKYTPEYLAWFYGLAAERKESKDYLPAPSHPVMGVCWYARYCVFCGGEEADKIVQPWDNVPVQEARRITRERLGLPL